MRRLLAFVALLSLTGQGLSGCALPGGPLGIDDVTRITVEATFPLRANLPPTPLAPGDADYAYTHTVALPINVLAELRRQKRDEDADTIEANRDKLEAVVLDAVEYEILAPNEMAAMVEPVVMYIAPPGVSAPIAEAREVGQTAAIGPREAVARRELVYVSTGLSDASALLTPLEFTVLFDASALVPRAQPIPAAALRARVRLRVTVRIDLAG